MGQTNNGTFGQSAFSSTSQAVLLGQLYYKGGGGGGVCCLTENTVKGDGCEQRWMLPDIAELALLQMCIRLVNSYHAKLCTGAFLS